MFYAFIRAVVSFALRLFYRVEVDARPLPQSGPVIFVGNHPNGLIDPALVFVITAREVTFLAKAPLFSTPVIGRILKGLRALPVYRRQDNPDPTQMARNEGTFEAATKALVDGCAITLFPEGKSHSEPGLAELKTGAARIALRAARRGAPPVIVPVGLTYEQKHRFRSRVLIDVGEPIEVARFAPVDDAAEPASVRELTDAVARGLRAVTLNLERWEDLPLVKTAEELYAFRLEEKQDDPERRRWFATGMKLFRAEQPERFERLREQVAAFERRMSLVNAQPGDLTIVYRRAVVYPFIFQNLASLFVGLPLFVVGVALFALPFWIPRWLNRAFDVEWDQQATVKLLSALVLSPVWAGLLTWIAWRFAGAGAAVFMLALCLPLALFTRYFLYRWRDVLRDVTVFLTLGNRARLKALLLVEGERIASDIERVAGEYRGRIDTAAPPMASGTA